MIFQHPIFYHVQNQALLNMAGKIELHDHLYLIGMQRFYHIFKLGCRIPIRAEGGFGRKIKTFLISPAIIF